MKLNLSDTLIKVLKDLEDALLATSNKDFDFKLELYGSELTLVFDDSVYFDLLGTDFERYFSKGVVNSITIDLDYYNF
jgi:hypothetical protein